MPENSQRTALRQTPFRKSRFCSGGACVEYSFSVSLRNSRFPDLDVLNISAEGLLRLLAGQASDEALLTTLEDGSVVIRSSELPGRLVFSRAEWQMFTRELSYLNLDTWPDFSSVDYTMESLA